jgi:hypothetical protein
MKAFDICIGFVIGVMMSAKISQNNNKIGLSHSKLGCHGE